MKIYSQDHSWAGIIVVVAANEEQARNFMSDAPNYDSTKPIYEHEIVLGLCFVNLGDM